MSWMGDRLAQLIAEGQKALGKEVVIMSETQEDEVDDGSGAWVEENGEEEPMSGRRTNPGLGLGLPPSYSPRTPSRRGRGMSVESDARSIASSYHEDESAWQSPEIRETMSRARTLYKQKRGL